jgi:ABC-2 type transport system ATP-binding protein
MRASRFQLWARSVLLLAGAVALLAVAPVAVERRAPLPASLVGASAAAIALFCVLAGRPPLWPRVPRVRAGPVAARLALLLARSTGEEIVWRWLILGSLAPAIGWPAALVVSTVGFALAHAGWQGLRGVAVHLLTGATFGAVFVGTGSLAAAVLAHAGYNVLVALAVETERTTQPAGRSWLRAADFLPAILEGVSKCFGRIEALRNVDLELRDGEVLALLGPNGAGKTTAVSILLGLRRPDEGTARLFGLDPRLAHARRRIGATPQESGFSPTLRVAEIVDFVRAHYAAPAAAENLLERFGLVELRDRQAGGLSGGERRRLAIALAFAGNPVAAFLDEPTAGLDVASRRAVWDGIRRFGEEGGTVLLTTHNLEEVEALATRVAVLSEGRLVADTTVPALKERVGLKRVRLVEQPLPPLAGVVQSALEAGRRVLYVADVGELVRGLVAGGADLDGLEILPVSLEEAFLAVTEGRA